MLALPGFVALSACGGAERASPTLPAPLADRLAAQSDSVADALDEGDGCEALRRLELLDRAAERAISAERVPAELRGELRRSLRTLRAGIDCAPPVQAPPAAPPVTTPVENTADDDSEDDDDRGPDKEKKKPKGNAYGHGGADDDDEDDD
jgi:hypothetical protein